jgi:hypothetical protein
MKQTVPEQTLAQNDELVKTVAAKIRPLPDNVVPSERFTAQMRLRLLSLQPKAPRRAA